MAAPVRPLRGAANGEKFANQYEYNNWVYYRVDRPPIVADDEPAERANFPVTGLSAGDFWINAGDQLFTWKDSQWVPLFAKGLLKVQDTMPPPEESQKGELWFNTDETHLTLYVFDGAVKASPAAPPVSLDGIESNIVERQDNVRYILEGNLIRPSRRIRSCMASTSTLRPPRPNRTKSSTNWAAQPTTTPIGSMRSTRSLPSGWTLEVGKWRYIQDGSTSNPQNGEFTLSKVDGSQPTRTWQDVAFARFPRSILRA